MAAKKKFELSHKDKDAVRKAFRKRGKTITIQGIVFSIRKFTHSVRYSVSGVEHKRQESWLFINPVRSELTPCASIEWPHDGANMRSSTLNSKR